MSVRASNLLLPQHAADLEASGLSDDQIRRCGFFSESDQVGVAKLLGWKSAKDIAALGPCLCIPFPGTDGRPTGYVRVKPDRPRTLNGKKVKYESPRKTPNRAHFPPGTLAALADPSLPLLMTEGEKKAAKADQDGFPCVGLVGVYGWQKKRAKRKDGKKAGPRELIPDLAEVAWTGRRVYVAFDSDAADKPGVRWAEWHFAQVLGAAGADVRVVRLPAGPDGAKVGLDDFLTARGPDALRRLIDTARPATDPAEGSGSSERLPGAADLLAGIGLSADLWHDPTGAAFATVGRHTHGVRSKGFRQYLVNEYRKRTGGKVANTEAVGNSLAVIEAKAVHDGPEHQAHVRVAGHGGRVYLALADPEGTVIEIDAGGWRACGHPPVRFRKPGGMLALPVPVPGGELAELRGFLNVPDDAAFALVAGWLMGCFRPDGPFPVMVLLGEQGSAKTTTARVLKRLIDPSSAAVRCEPKESRDMMIQARNNWVLSFDNLSGLPGWLSDAFCRLATGGGFSTRGLYSDDEEMIFEAKRPLVMNGIEEFVTRADLLERSLLIYHPPIPEERRRAEAEFWAGFDAAHPKLLGAVLDRVSAGLREMPKAKPERLPRMADFALFAAACERGAGDGQRFRSAYDENQAGAHEQALDASPLPAAVLALMNRRDLWEGTPAQLLGVLSRHATHPPPKDWPKAPNVLTGKLRRLAPNLRRVHRLDVDCDGRVSGGRSGGMRSRFVRITRLPESARAPSSPPSPKSRPDGESRGVNSKPDGDGPGGRSPPPDGNIVPRDRPPRGAATAQSPGATHADGDGGDDPSPSPSGHREAGDRRPLWQTEWFRNQMLPD